MESPSQPQGSRQTLKRKRSVSVDTVVRSSPAKRSQSHLQINYLARRNHEDVPLLSADDSLPETLSLLNQYHGIVERHESLAGNLGARPLGPTIVKRFERMFDSPPKVLASQDSQEHGCHSISWLELVDFAKKNPNQFNMAKQTEQRPKLRHVHMEQYTVQISEGDYDLVRTGLPEKMVPPQPIMEDEEKELGTLEILEKLVWKISHLSDQVAARARQLNHRLKARKQAIIDRRAAETTISGAAALRASSPSNVALMNGSVAAAAAGVTVEPQSPLPCFAKANTRQIPDFVWARDQVQSIGSADPTRASAATRKDLLSKFLTNAERRTRTAEFSKKDHKGLSFIMSESPSPSQSVSKRPRLLEHTPDRGSHQSPYEALRSSDSLQTPLTPISLLLSTRGQLSTERDDGGPFKAEVLSRLESVAKGEKLNPPCDRCRRRQMDCIRHMTACAGCTKKHAKCSWREVTEHELNAVSKLTFLDDDDIHGISRPEQQLSPARPNMSSGFPQNFLTPSRQPEDQEIIHHEAEAGTVAVAPASPSNPSPAELRIEDDTQIYSAQDNQQNTAHSPGIRQTRSNSSTPTRTPTDKISQRPIHAATDSSRIAI